MKITELLPTEEDWKRLQGIESTLLRRRTAGRFAGVIAILSAALQVVLAIAEKGYIEKLLTLELDRKAVIIFGILFTASLIYFLMRRTSVLLKESKSAFRYTFWIEPFTEVDNKPCDRLQLGASNRFKLLHHDLTERFHLRIKQRFSILKEFPASAESAEEDVSKTAPKRYSSHIHISGHIAIREKDEGKWVVHVIPEVRIGPPGVPATLAQPVEYPITSIPFQEQNQTEAPRDKIYVQPLEVNEYLDIVERVYSSVATKVFEQIESDVRLKIALFPTSHLRSIALFHEAEDFTHSNTVDAYERAIPLYREALRYFDLTNIRTITSLFLGMPILWRIELKYQHEWASIVAGYAKCLIYRRETSELSGRQSNTLFELPELLKERIDALNKLQKYIGKRGLNSRFERSLAYFMYPQESWFNHYAGGTNPSLFDHQKNALFELYLVQALTYHFLENSEQASESLADAAASAPDRVTRDALYLVTKGLLEPIKDKALVYLRQGVEFAPDFHFAWWFLAQTQEKVFRQQDEITLERAQVVMDEFDEVVKLNNGSIYALSAQGYLRWLIKDNQAKKYFEHGIQVKAIASETFIGELNYRLARIAAESGNFDECCRLYLEATAADPEIGAFYPDEGSRVRSADFDEIGSSMLRRFETYKNTVENLIAQQQKDVLQDDFESQRDHKPVSENTQHFVHAFVLNDYANACLRYFHHHGEQCWLDRAIKAYDKATKLNPADARPWFNLVNGYEWAREYDKMDKCATRASQLSPTWTLVAILAAKMKLVSKKNRFSELDEKIRLKEEDIKHSEKDLERTRSELGIFKIGTLTRAVGDTASKKDILETQPVQSITIPVDASRRGAGLESIESKSKPRLPQSATGYIKFEADGKVRELESKLNGERLKLDKLNLQKKKLPDEFLEARNEALKLISENSRLAALFDAPIKDQIQRLVSIPRRKLDGSDVQTMLYLAEVLSIERPKKLKNLKKGEELEELEELEAAETLAAHLFKLFPENHRVTDTLLNLVPQLLPENRHAGLTNHTVASKVKRQKLLELANEQSQKIVKKWMETNRLNFLALYWYALSLQQTGGMAQDRFVGLAQPKEIKEDNFRETFPDAYEDLWGWVQYHLGKYPEASEAFTWATELNPQKARYHFHLGQSLEQQSKLEAARAAYCEAITLEPEPTEYREGLASVLNFIGNQHWVEDRFADAADNYKEAVRLAPGEAVYYRNLSLAYEKAKLPDLESALKSAIQEMQSALDLKPHNIKYLDERRRLKTRLAAQQCYGSSRIMAFMTGVTPFAVEYGTDMEPFVHPKPDMEIKEDLKTRYGKLRNRIKLKYGVDIPDAGWRLNENIPADSYYVMVREIFSPKDGGNLQGDMKFCMRTIDELQTLGLWPYPAPDPLGTEDVLWLEKKDWPIAQANEILLFDALDYVLRHLEDILVSRLHEFLSYNDIVRHLKKSPLDTLLNLPNKPEQINQLMLILKALLAERTPITEFDRICGKFLELADNDSLCNVVEHLRSLEGVREQLWGNSEEFTLIPLGVGFTKMIKDNLRGNGMWQILALERKTYFEALAAVRDALDESPLPPALIVESPELRIHVRKLIESEFPRLPVLSKGELKEGLTVSANRRIELKDESETLRAAAAGVSNAF